MGEGVEVSRGEAEELALLSSPLPLSFPRGIPSAPGRILEPDQQSVELVGDALAVRVVEGRRAPGLHSGLAQLLQEIARRQD